MSTLLLFYVLAYLYAPRQDLSSVRLCCNPRILIFFNCHRPEHPMRYDHIPFLIKRNEIKRHV